MSVRELVTLGTASQVPTRYRNHNGYFVRWDDEGFLFDPGEGTQRQMTLADLAASSITRICVTHFHGDHCLGLPGVIQRLSLDKVPHEVRVYFPASGRAYFERLRKASIFRNSATVTPVEIEASGVIERTSAFELIARRLEHGVDVYGYRVQEHDDVRMLPEKLDALGVRGPAIGQLKREGRLALDDGRVVELSEVSLHKPGQSVAVVMDTRLCEGAFELARGVDLLICESTYLSSEEREAREHGHLTAAQAARIALESGARKLVLTHFSQRYPSLGPFVEEARRIFPNVVAVRDLQRVAVPRRRTEAEPEEPVEETDCIDGGEA